VLSAYPGPILWGAGFLARLSGSTSEFLSMWNIFMAGPSPFNAEGGKITLSFRPLLPSWLFSDNDTVSFTFLGTSRVTYHNPRRLNT
ncbi:unnamed protein product, partial [Discosporangium mesarthrocarpum]